MSPTYLLSPPSPSSPRASELWLEASLEANL